MTKALTVSPDTMLRLADLAVEAGTAIMRLYSTGASVDAKADGSPVTEADQAAHRIISRALLSWDPAIPLISEEGDLPPLKTRRQWHRFWLVDPLDGTKEFIKRNGEFTVNIALIEAGIPVLGVIYAPAIDLLYYAGAGLGSWKRHRGEYPERLVSTAPLPGHALRVAESRSHPSAALEAYLATVNVSERVIAGSSLKFCWIAEGKADIYPRLGPTMEWDVAAGDCIFRNSGVPVLRASPLEYNQPELKNNGFVIGLPTPDPEPGTSSGVVVWLTGLSGSGKTTIARQLADRLTVKGRPVELLDGDSIREVFPATGFSKEERESHIRRVGFVASRLARHGVVAIAALVSPYRESREFVRRMASRYLEVYVATPLEECRRRDVKGLYARALRGEIANFTGISDPYEPPANPAVTIDTTAISVEASVDQILVALDGMALGSRA